MRKCRQCKSQIPAKKDCDLSTVEGRIQSGGFCGADCLSLHGREKAHAARERKAEREARAKRAKHKADKERIKTKADHARECQQVFNAWVRLRDAGQPCISCDKPDDGTHQRHASHYRSRGACPELAFEPLNVHASCAQCNTMLSGNVVEFRLRLVRKIGQDAVDWLEGKHEPKRYTIEQLKEIKAEYRAKVRELKW